MKKYNIRPATADDIKSFYGSFLHTMQGIVIEDEEEVVGIACVTLEKGRMTALSEMKKTLPAKAIWKVVLAFQKILKDIKGPIIAIREERYPNSENFLKRSGFIYLYDLPEGEIYIWDNSYCQ